MKIWEYARLNYEDYQKLSVEDRSSMLKSYYVDMFTCLVTVQVHGFVFCCLLSVCLIVLQVSHTSLLLRELVVTSTTQVFFLCIAMKFLICFLGKSSSELDVLSGMKSANLVSMTKSATESDKNLTTQIVVTRF